MNPGTNLSLGKFSLLIVRVRNFGLMYFAFQEIEKKENGERRRDQRGAAATKLPGSMKAIPKLEARNAGAKSRQQQCSICPQGKKTRGSMKSKESLTLSF